MLLILFLQLFTPAQANPLDQGTSRIPLWANGPPLATGSGEPDTPTITVWRAPSKNATRSAVIICPGGGYGGLATNHEGKDPAEYLTNLGIQAFILRYRHAPQYKHPVPLMDCQRAVRWVRAHAEKYQINPEKIGLWGFSAGGHLVSTASTQFTPADPGNPDLFERPTSRPNFAILCYPVISMESPTTHAGSRRNLLGENPDQALVKKLSNHLNVDSKTPPTFLFHTREDKAVILKNSELYADALKKAGVEHELVVFEKGPHGVGLGGSDPVLSQWPKKLERWLQSHAFAPQ